ncbi:hypothetical protein Fot_13870 [Forsythia ovata]|uniref:Uncharacterized protein n=1 Tax=Forsythia ovata TaxID=205694 RepID=A0ABD1W4Y9_9LAMI
MSEQYFSLFTRRSQGDNRQVVKDQSSGYLRRLCQGTYRLRRVAGASPKVSVSVNHYLVGARIAHMCLIIISLWRILYFCQESIRRQSKENETIRDEDKDRAPKRNAGDEDFSGRCKEEATKDLGLVRLSVDFSSRNLRINSIFLMLDRAHQHWVPSG